MPFILRVDVDKPYGRKTVLQKVLSKLREDFYFPALKSWGFGTPAITFANFLAANNICGHFYFRLVTLLPTTDMTQLISQGHKIGWHLENSQNEDTFINEMTAFRQKLKPLSVEINSFTKHGGGNFKLGLNHYAPYEPDKYLAWAKKHNLGFFFGNGCQNPTLNVAANVFFPEMFWVNTNWRDPIKQPLPWIIEQAKTKYITVILHPENYFAVDQVWRDFNLLLKLTRQANIAWITVDMTTSPQVD